MLLFSILVGFKLPKVGLGTGKFGLPSVAALGQQSYKVNRGHFSNDSFTDPSLVSALQSNPYAKSLSSVA